MANFVPDYRETLDIGSDLGTAVSANYEAPNAFTGRIQNVTVDLK